MYKFVVCGGNIALGIFPCMGKAYAALEKSCEPGSVLPMMGFALKPGESFCNVSGKYQGEKHQFTITAVKESEDSSPMF